MCKNDCSLFWKETIASEQCHVYGKSHWIDKNTKGKKVPQKVLRFPLTPPLQRLYGSRHTAENMRWHSIERLKDEGLTRHVNDDARLLATPHVADEVVCTTSAGTSSSTT